MVFDIVCELQRDKGAVCFDEPRVLYMNDEAQGFDIWSKKAYEKWMEMGKSMLNVDSDQFNITYLNTLQVALPTNTKFLIEKMPEHVLRPIFLSQL